MNHAYNVADLFSFDNLFIFINTFDSGLLFGAPLLILGNFLQMRIESMKNGHEKTAVRFSMNERMILNTIVTGVCICTLVGVAIYLMNKYRIDGSLSIFGEIYLFETLAMNTYFALSIGFMRFTEQRISRPIEALAHIAGNYSMGHATDEQRRQLINSCEVYSDDTTEVGELARSYISMIRDLERYVSNLQTITAEKERINAELTLASDIQLHMLPQA